MARTLQVYPKGVLVGSSWELVVDVYEYSTGVKSEFRHTFAAGVIAETPLVLLKIAFDVIVGDTVTDLDVDTALVADDIRPGPQVETVWGNWQAVAETIINGLPGGYTAATFQAAWSKQQTSGVRSDARRALITQRGWTIPVGSIHQHEGDGTATVA